MKKVLQALALILFTYPAFANLIELTDLESPIIVSGEPITPEDVITFSPSPADAIWFSDKASADFTSQDSAALLADIEANIFTNATLTAAGQWDSLSGDGTTYDANAFNVIAVHYDNKELVFGYINAIDNFTINDLGQEISNVRTYTATGGIFEVQQCETDCTSVSAPGTIALLSLGLVGLYTARKQRA